MSRGVQVFGLFLVACGSVLAVGQSEGVKEYACRYEARSGSGEATLEIKDGVVRSVHFTGFSPGLPGNIGYTCTVDATRGDKETKWKETGRTLRIDFVDGTNNDEEDYLTIAPTADGYLLDMSATRSGSKCGAGAELPKQIRILKAAKRCRVKL